MTRADWGSAITLVLSRGVEGGPLQFAVSNYYVVRTETCCSSRAERLWAGPVAFRAVAHTCNQNEKFLASFTHVV